MSCFSTHLCQNEFLYGLLNKLFRRNFLCNFNFFRQITNHSAIYYCKKPLQHPMGKKALQKSFATSHGKKSFAKINLTKKMCLQRKFQHYCLFSKPYRNMLLHDHCAGCKGFATSRGSYFIPRGEAPRDEMTPKGCSKTFASQTMIVQ